MGANPIRQLGHSSRKQFERLGRMRVEALNVKGSFCDSATVRAVIYVNAEQAPKIPSQEPNLHSKGEGHRRRIRGNDRFSVDGPAGVWATARQKRKPVQHGKPGPVTSAGQRAAREGQARPVGVSERLIVPMKPGNSGGGKGPWFKRSVERGDSGRLT